MKKLNGITDVFFDLDHTLWDFDKNSALTFEKIFEMNKIKIHLDAFLSFYEPINLNYWKLYREERIDKASLRFGRLHDAFEALDFKVPEDMIYRLSSDYIEHLPSFNHLFDHTLEILDYLYRNYNLHIITNGFEEVQHGKLINSKIYNYFKTITNSEKVGVKKPHPKIFNHALKVANVNAGQSVMIGDNYEADILGAINIGMDAIFVGASYKEVYRTVKRVDDLIQIKRYL
ncbi:YjjG family noncanonical pyrimidine nucleotidase [Aestuariivivens sediminis]|uniref:YjjG family noncanonical pyrimidine nucleotidase n=1 Tax=Aestuariivivens sediminis TaxID=2913557 RepID=UPI001F5988CB|nr:YjjG family noncanonical pyrimidine nucleotidase [Aestuariivivens sediminis]